MKPFKVITDADFELENKPMNNPHTREAARGVIVNSDGLIAILNKQKKNEFKLVGGGIDEGESPEDAFRREVAEEAGAKIDNIRLIGTIEERKSHDNFCQTSYVFAADVIDVKEPSYTKKEKDEGARTLWMNVDEAMEAIKDCEDKLVASDYESVYHTKFIVRRDYEILKYYKRREKDE